MEGNVGCLCEKDEEFVVVGWDNRFEWSRMEVGGFGWLVTVDAIELATGFIKGLILASEGVEWVIFDGEVIWAWVI